MLHDREAEAEAAVRARDGRVLLAERLEDVRQERRLDARAGVAHDDLDVRVLALHADVDPAALGRELHRVREQVPDDLLEPAGVAAEHARVGVEQDLEAHALRLGGGAHDLDGRLDDLRRLDRREREPQPAGHDPAEVEQVLDELDLDPGVALDRLERARALLLAQRAGAEHAGSTRGSR